MSYIIPTNDEDVALKFLLHYKVHLISSKRKFILHEKGKKEIICYLTYINETGNGDLKIFVPKLNQEFELEFMNREKNGKGFFWRCEGKENSKELEKNRKYFRNELELNLRGPWYKSEIAFLNTNNSEPPFRSWSQCFNKLKNDKIKRKRGLEDKSIYLPKKPSKKYKPLVPDKKSQFDRLIRVLELSLKIDMKTINFCLSKGMNPEISLLLKKKRKRRRAGTQLWQYKEEKRDHVCAFGLCQV